MRKYVIEGCLIFFLVVIGVGIVGEINASGSMEDEVSSFEDKLENNETIDDGNISKIEVKKEDTSNLISNTVTFFANIIVEVLNEGLKLMVKLMSRITN